MPRKIYEFYRNDKVEGILLFAKAKRSKNFYKDSRYALFYFVLDTSLVLRTTLSMTMWDRFVLDL